MEVESRGRKRYLEQREARGSMMLQAQKGNIKCKDEERNDGALCGLKAI